MVTTKFFVCLILLAAAACAAPTSGVQLTVAPGPLASPASAVAPLPSATAVPTVASSVLAQPNPSATARFGDFPTAALTVHVTQTGVSPTTAATVNSRSTPLAPNGWNSFTSTKLQAVVEFPPGWTAREDSLGVSFTSPAGAAIVLARVDTSGASAEDFLSETLLPNTRCSSSINAHGLSVRSCLDTIARSHFAYLFIKPAGGSERLWSLSTGSREPLDVFNAMIETVHPAP
jgi:hypothetical protein